VAIEEAVGVTAEGDLPVEERDSFRSDFFGALFVQIRKFFLDI
jgi:hypothetical protein